MNTEISAENLKHLIITKGQPLRIGIIDRNDNFSVYSWNTHDCKYRNEKNNLPLLTVQIDTADSISYDADEPSEEISIKDLVQHSSEGIYYAYLAILNKQGYYSYYRCYIVDDYRHQIYAGFDDMSIELTFSDIINAKLILVSKEKRIFK